MPTVFGTSGDDSEPGSEPIDTDRRRGTRREHAESQPSEGDRALRARMSRVALAVLPDWFQALLREGFGRAFALLIGAVLVLPLLGVYLASLWLSIATTDKVPFLASARDAYVDQIFKGFGI